MKETWNWHFINLLIIPPCASGKGFLKAISQRERYTAHTGMAHVLLNYLPLNPTSSKSSASVPGETHHSLRLTSLFLLPPQSPSSLPSRKQSFPSCQGLELAEHMINMSIPQTLDDLGFIKQFQHLWGTLEFSPVFTPQWMLATGSGRSKCVLLFYHTVEWGRLIAEATEAKVKERLALGH